MLPMKTTRTAQYAAVNPKTSCFLELERTEVAVAKRKAATTVIYTIDLVDNCKLRKRYKGISNDATDVAAMMTFLKTASLGFE